MLRRSGRAAAREETGSLGEAERGPPCSRLRRRGMPGSSCRFLRMAAIGRYAVDRGVPTGFHAFRDQLIWIPHEIPARFHCLGRLESHRTDVQKVQKGRPKLHIGTVSQCAKSIPMCNLERPFCTFCTSRRACVTGGHQVGAGRATDARMRSAHRGGRPTINATYQ